jgi:hypothetical protein
MVCYVLRFSDLLCGELCDGILWHVCPSISDVLCDEMFALIFGILQDVCAINSSDSQSCFDFMSIMQGVCMTRLSLVRMRSIGGCLHSSFVQAF